MFDIGIGEFLVLAVLALLVFGPDRLPRVTAQATSFLRQLREQAASARQEISAAVDLDATGLSDLAELHPRRLARSVLEPLDQVRADVTDAVGATGAAGAGGPAKPSRAAPSAPGPGAAPAPRPTAEGAPPAYDPDAT